MLTINIYPETFLTKRIVEKMVERPKQFKSAVISLCSRAGVMAVAYSPAYCASKAYIDFFSRSLAFEFKDKIDFLSLRPSFV